MKKQKNNKTAANRPMWPIGLLLVFCADEGENVDKGDWLNGPFAPLILASASFQLVLKSALKLASSRPAGQQGVSQGRVGRGKASLFM